MNIKDRIDLSLDIFRGMNNITWPSTYQEPDYVAKLVTTLPNVISHSLRTLMPGRTISVGGAFVHQKPLANFVKDPKKKSPELGDLLVVCREKRACGYVCNALLLQAKCVDDVMKAYVPKDHQFILYSEWPLFEYKRAGNLNGVRRGVGPKTITQGAQYLLIDKSDPAKMFTATVNNPLEGTTHLAFALASVIAFDRGRTFRCNHPRDGWSRMICDLLTLTANSAFNRRKAGYIDKSRSAGDRVFNLFMNRNNNYYNVPVIENEDDNGDYSGVSVLCVDLGDAEEQQKPEMD